MFDGLSLWFPHFKVEIVSFYKDLFLQKSIIFLFSVIGLILTISKLIEFCALMNETLFNC